MVRVVLVGFVLVASAWGQERATQPTSRPAMLPGFEQSPHFGEQVLTYTFEPDVRVHVNAAGDFDPARPTRLVLYALPNGNTIEQTIGRAKAEGVDWHFFIQHIGAQTRALRQVVPDENVVVAYLEAGAKSWPSWRGKHADSGARIVALVEELRARFEPRVRVTLASHSGGGSLIFGFLNAVDAIPDWIERIVWLDANYAYSDEQGHGDKLIRWLEAPGHYLGVYAYDDRDVKLDGKNIVGPTGGTYRKTQTVLERLRRDLKLTEEVRPEYKRYRALDGRVDVILLENPQGKILHTVMVERNGFAHGLTFGTPLEGKAGEFWGPAAYERFIQPEQAGPTGKNNHRGAEVRRHQGTKATRQLGNEAQRHGGSRRGTEGAAHVGTWECGEVGTRGRKKPSPRHGDRNRRARDRGARPSASPVRGDRM